VWPGKVSLTRWCRNWLSRMRRSQWLRPVILATQEAEIRRIIVWSQLWANSSRDPILKKPITKKG
jgi:hypothetical protein